MKKGLLAPQLGLLVLGVVVGMAVACNTTDGPDDADEGTGGTGGYAAGGRVGSGGRGGTGGQGTGGSATGGLGGNGGEGPSCTPKHYGVEELCFADWFASRFVDSSIPDDPLNNVEYVCTSARPEIPAGNTDTALFRYREGCGLAEWELEDLGPPWQRLIWELDSKELVGCAYLEDYPIEEQCGDHTRYAGERFECEEVEQHYCVLESMGGAGGAGS